jgi:hypothetical protein
MFEGDGFPPRAHRHAELPFANGLAPAFFVLHGLTVRSFDMISYRFLEAIGPRQVE